MKLVTAPLHRRLLANGARPGADHVPVLKLFDPCGAATWLFTERDPDHPDRLFGPVRTPAAAFPSPGTRAWPSSPARGAASGCPLSVTATSPPALRFRSTPPPPAGPGASSSAGAEFDEALRAYREAAP